MKCHDKSPNTDGYIELVDEKNHPVGKLTIQAKSYKSKYKGKDKAEIPAYYVAYADRMRNEVCLFFSVDADSQRIYWKYISDDYIQEFKKAGNRTSQTYKFAKDEILSKGNLNLTLGTANANKTVYVRGYIVYKDKNGISHEKYTNVLISLPVSN